MLDQFDQQMLDLMNGARATAGAPALTAAPGLRTLALGWSTFMADGGTGGVLQHNPNVRAQLPSNGAASATAWAENVASWSPGTGRDAASVFGLYMNSPGHKANILNPAMRFVGIGTVINGANVGFNTQNFTNAIDPVTPPTAQPPIGHVDSLTVVGTTVVVRGWAYDPAASSLSSTAKITAGTVTRVVTADVATGRCECRSCHHRPARGDEDDSIGVGTTRVCVTALSISGGLSTQPWLLRRRQDLISAGGDRRAEHAVGVR